MKIFACGGHLLAPKTIVVKYALDELLKGAELDELFNEKNELYPNFSMVPQKYTLLTLKLK